MILIFF
ncbi:hypothetical protein CFP56_035750 [Quercus suber]